MNLLIQFLPADVLTRLVWALLISVAGVVVFQLINRVVLKRAQKNNQPSAGEFLLIHNGKPSIVYFTTPECAPCKTIQRPALRKLQDRLGDQLEVIEVNAQERPDLASRWGVLSVPTTFIIDSSGQLRHVNHGVTRSDKLFQQVEGLK